MWDLVPPTSQPLGRITVERDGDGHVLLRLAGDIDAATVDAYEEPQLGASVISVIDLTEVEFLSSSGVAFLIRRTQSSRERGLLPAVRGLSTRAQRILQLTGALNLFQPVAEASGARSTVSQRSA
jgi:anti-sigma B factor antagonist